MSEVAVVEHDQAVNADPFYDAASAAAYLGLKPPEIKHPAQAVRRLARLRLVTHTRIGGRLMFRRSWLEAHVQEHMVPAGAG